MNMKIQITSMTPDDIPDFIKLNDDFNGAGSATYESAFKSLQNNVSEIILIARVDSEAAGFIIGKIGHSVCYKTDHGEIDELFVSELYRRKGVASQLMQYLENIFQSKDVYIITLNTGIKNFAAQKFYEKCGYLGKEEMIYRKNLFK